MKQFVNKMIIIFVFSIMVIVVAGVWFFEFRPTSKTVYVGSKPERIEPSRYLVSQVNHAILNIHPDLPDGVSSYIQMYEYTATAVRGDISYSRIYKPVQFMVAKSGNKWVIVDQTTNKTLTLPNITTAKKYNLPTGWYSND
jgi:hypothetical protein